MFGIEVRHRLSSTSRGRNRVYFSEGFSLVELVTVLAILGVLFALFLPAVQAAREVSRRISCANNVKQVGMAIQSFEGVQGHFPQAFCGVRPGAPDWCLSPAGQLAEHLDGLSIADAIDSLEHSVRDHEWDRLSIESPEVLRCPSDSLAQGRASSYRFCRGVLPLWPEDPGGVFVWHTPLIGARDVTDGLSNTAFVSERLIGSSGGSDHRRDLLLTRTHDYPSLAGDCVAANQGNLPGLPAQLTSPVGSRWLSGLWRQVSYYHFLPPNSDWRDCIGNQGYPGLVLLSARSNHRSGVHVGFGDGRCAFVSDEVELTVWRSVATRAGGEVFTLSL